MSERAHCNQPDRDAPGTKCGYPLPCPWHTAVIDTTKNPVSVALGIEDDYKRPLKRKRLEKIGKAIASHFSEPTPQPSTGEDYTAQAEEIIRKHVVPLIGEMGVMSKTKDLRFAIAQALRNERKNSETRVEVLPQLIEIAHAYAADNGHAVDGTGYYGSLFKAIASLSVQPPAP